MCSKKYPSLRNKPRFWVVRLTFFDAANVYLWVVWSPYHYPTGLLLSLAAHIFILTYGTEHSNSVFLQPNPSSIPIICGELKEPRCSSTQKSDFMLSSSWTGIQKKLWAGKPSYDRPLEQTLAKWVAQYNNDYHHSALGYKPLRQYDDGNPCSQLTQFVAAW